MGWWGCGSDENDDTYNDLGFGIMDRFAGISIKQEPESLKAVSDIMNNEILPKASWPMGVVIWCLRQNLTIDEKYLKQVREEMVAEQDRCRDAGETDPTSWELRREAALFQELQEIDSALANDGRSIIERESQTLADKMSAPGEAQRRVRRRAEDQSNEEL